MRRLATAASSALLLLAALIALTPAPAAAFRGHAFGSDFGWGVSDGKGEAEVCATGCKPGVAGAGAGQFSDPVDVAVNDATGHVYVLDQGNSRIEAFDHEGHYLSQFDGSETPAKVFSFGAEELTGGIAVDNSCYLKKLAGSACTVADPSNGDVYVTDPGHHVVDKFSAEGKYLSQLEECPEKGSCAPFAFAGTEEEWNPAGVSVDSSGVVWVHYEGGHSSTVVASFTNSEPSTISSKLQLNNLINTTLICYGFAVDDEGDFYVRDRRGGSCASGEVFKFGSAGEGLIAPFVAEDSSAVAVDLSSGEVFLDNVGSVGAFSPVGSGQERFGSGDLVGGAGLAVDHEAGTNSTVFVADGVADRVVVFVAEPPGPPLVVGESVVSVTADSAELRAEVNPRGAGTEYRFEYGPCATPTTCVGSPYEQSIPVPDAVVGSDFELHAVTANPQGLLAGTAYHFRVRAHNVIKGTVQTVTGKEETFTTQPAGVFELPDGRQWEMVSPADKHGALLEPIGEAGVIQAAAAGDAFTYLSDAPTEAQAGGNGPAVQVLSSRGPGGWSTRDIAPAHERATGPSIGAGEEYRFFSSDLSLGVLQPFGAFTRSLSPQASEQTPYLRHSTTGAYTPLVSGCPEAGEPCQPLVQEHADVPAGTLFGEEGHCPPSILCGPRFQGATPDLSHVVLSSHEPLTETRVKDGLYEWAEGRLALISVLPAGEGGTAVTGRLGQVDVAGVTSDARYAISTDGSRVVWTSGGAEPHLYLRERTGEAGAETVRLDPGLKGKPEFQSASVQGSEVFFTDSGDLYEYDLEEGRLLHLTEGAGVLGSLPGVSEDGSYVYFVADGVLASGAVPGQCTSGATGASPLGATCNLYVLHGGVVKLVAVLSGADLPDWREILGGLTARVSPDGRWLAFMSQRSLTGYDNRDAVSGRPDEEVYLYSAEQERLVCASCNPTGARPAGIEVGNSVRLVSGFDVWPSTAWLAGNIPGWTPYSVGQALYQSRYLSDTGRLFFNSSEALVPQDVNGTWDVYEYEPPGVGSCTTASVTYGERSGGCVGIISSGSSPEESAFLDASETGSDVFFLTQAKLSPQDNDTSLDVYDAHQCTPESPCIPASATQPPACITESSCRPAPTPQPSIFGPPASATFTGLGNLTPEIVKPPPAKPTAAQERAKHLAAALKACKHRYPHSKKKRQSCEKAAHKAYGAKASAKRSTVAKARGR